MKRRDLIKCAEADGAMGDMVALKCTSLLAE